MIKKLSVLIVILLMSVLVSGCAGSAFAQESTPGSSSASQTEGVTRTLNVNGSGQATLTPDIAYINIGVHTEDKDASKAVNENNTRAQNVADALEAMGIDKKDIQTTNFSIYPQQEYSPEGRPTGEITYIVDNTVFVTLRDLDMIGDLLNEVVAAGANSINGIQFDVADKTAALSDARKSAVENAQAVAQELVDAAGVSLGEIQTISTYSSGAPLPMYDGRGGAVMAAESSVPVSPGQMTITVQVNIVYEIR